MTGLVILLSIGVLVVGAVIGTVVVRAIARARDIDQTPMGDRSDLYGWDDDYQFQSEKDKSQEQEKVVEDTAAKQEEIKESNQKEKVEGVEIEK